ncbi:aquaporin [Niveispirillum cyanobacteriorum]|uniref:Aquaporin family protein n=1 Tax=Niveispirillum cyanobacteriorum TaxID=1612173 RepID=A0A2K9NHC9_9PROT|nr:MIP/aquaporin family protein [Niveispirillum cyanobacteriorum]AUN32504.1 aquaporin family protein [Niveispirillum cyanobacteriorum]GGE77857.1 glycerol uptake transporter protein [Niveispirillum cyanobacteriorum]
MTRPSLFQALIAEGIGTALLLAVIVGSGIMAWQLAGGNGAVALLANAIATGGALVALIHMFGPLSGAHFNPAVTLALAATGYFPRSRVAAYLAVQAVAAVSGVLLAHGMFNQTLVQVSATVRTGPGQWLSEAVATLVLVTIILRALRSGTAAALSYAVPLAVMAGYWYTASTGFTNPAVTLARSLTDSFAGIRPLDVPGFILAQAAGLIAGLALDRALRSTKEM